MNDHINEGILRACLKAGFNGEKISGVSLPADAAGWQSLGDFITRHNLDFFFYTAVKKGWIPLDVPDDIMDSWKNVLRRTVVYNALLKQELEALLPGLEEIGVQPILLKGLALHFLYEDILARPSSDIDLLITREDYEKTRDYLLEKGFNLVMVPDFRGTLPQFIELQEKYFTEITLQKRLGVMAVNIDLHWEMDGIYDGSPLEELFPIDKYPWHRYTRTDNWEQLTFQTLTPEMHFIHLITHYALHHQYQGAKWFLDLLLFVHYEGGRLDWDFIDEIVAEPDCRKIIGLTLRLMEDLGMSLPEGVPPTHHFWPGPAFPGELRFFRKRIFSAPSKVRQHIGYILLPLQTRDKLRVASYYLFNKNAVSFWRIQDAPPKIPAPLQPLYLLYRTLTRRG
jgi:hypothetical protein